MLQRLSFPFLFFSFFLPLCSSALAAQTVLDFDPQVLAVLGSSQETMRFSISWSGGLKIGDLRLRFAPAASGGQIISARVTDYGLFRFVYPVEDSFVTSIRGPFLLPERYEVKQIERSKIVDRLTLYDQKQFKVVYQKQNQPPQRWQLNGPVHNAFSAFFVTRALRLSLKRQQFIPAFVNKKRQLVPVNVVGLEKKDSIFGRVNTFKMQPKMSIKGLYDKDGETVFWLTDDACRVPVEIRSNLLVGSLTAELVEYSNPACPLHDKRTRK